MTHKFLISTAAAALVAGTVFAAAQGTSQQAPSGGAMERGAPAQGQSQTGQGQMQGEPQGQGREQSQPGQKRGQSQQGQPKTTGQGEPKAGQGEGKQQGQTQQRQPEGRQGQNPEQGQGQPKQGAQQKSGGNGASVTFTTEQRTKIRETVLRGSNAPRVTNVDFSIKVGTAVPSRVKIVAVPDVIVEVRPQWRGFLYFVVEDQIIIVDRNHKIVAVLDV
jgi:hypothetical protein